MKVYNYSTQQLAVNGNNVDSVEFYVAGGFDGTVSIGGSDLTFPDDCTNVVVVDNGAGLEIWYEETPMPQIYTMSCIMVLLGGAVLMMKLVQKLKVSP